MITKFVNRLIVVAVFVVLAATVIGLASKPVTAQDAANRDMRALLERLVGGGADVTVLFDKPLVSGEGVWTLPDRAAGRTISQVGADYLCFSEPWNNSTRERCTLFANLTSVSYLTP